VPRPARPAELGCQNGQAKEDQEPAGAGEHQQCDADEGNDESGDEDANAVRRPYKA